MNPLTHSTTSTSGRRFDLAIVGIVGLPARYGGFETLADHLVRRLGRRYRMLVYCSSRGLADRPTHYRDAQLHYIGFDANGWQSIFYDAVALLQAPRQASTLLVLGVSGCVMLPLVRLLAPRTRIVTNIDGLEWKRQKWGPMARRFLKLSERIAVRFSHEVIADNRAIQEHVRGAYGRASQLIAYGGDTPTRADASAQARRSTRLAPGQYFFTVCRIEPENHLDEILQAFAALPEVPLLIVGNWNVSPYARTLRERYGALPNIELLDPIYDAGSLRRLRSEARAYVHGHSAGGTNPSLVEAMHAGMAVFAFDVTYNRHTMHQLGWYWKDPAELRAAVAATDDEQLQTTAQALRDVALRHYTWDIVARQYEEVLFRPPVDRPAAVSRLS